MNQDRITLGVQPLQYAARLGKMSPTLAFGCVEMIKCPLLSLSSSTPSEPWPWSCTTDCI